MGPNIDLVTGIRYLLILRPLVVDIVVIMYTLFYKNFFYKKVEAEIDTDFKNLMRTYPT